MPANSNAIALKSKSQSGISMIEVLIAILILTIGLLGMAALQAKATQFNHSAYLRTQAVNLTYDIGDRIRANRAPAISGAYNHAFSANKPTGTSIAAQDLSQWLTILENTLPGGEGAVSTNGNVITIQIRWNDARQENALQTFVTRLTL